MSTRSTVEAASVAERFVLGEAPQREKLPHVYIVYECR